MKGLTPFIVPVLALLFAQSAWTSCAVPGEMELKFRLSRGRVPDQENIEKFIALKYVSFIEFDGFPLELADSTCLHRAIQTIDSFGVRVDEVRAELAGRKCSGAFVGERIRFTLRGQAEGDRKDSVSLNQVCALMAPVRVN